MKHFEDNRTSPEALVHFAVEEFGEYWQLNEIFNLCTPYKIQ